MNALFEAAGDWNESRETQNWNTSCEVKEDMDQTREEFANTDAIFIAAANINQVMHLDGMNRKRVYQFIYHNDVVTFERRGSYLVEHLYYF